MNIERIVINMTNNDLQMIIYLIRRKEKIYKLKKRLILECLMIMIPNRSYITTNCLPSPMESPWIMDQLMVKIFVFKNDENLIYRMLCTVDGFMQH